MSSTTPKITINRHICKKEIRGSKIKETEDILLANEWRMDIEDVKQGMGSKMYPRRVRLLSFSSF
jgi:hypothetical protein